MHITNSHTSRFHVRKPDRLAISSSSSSAKKGGGGGECTAASTGEPTVALVDPPWRTGWETKEKDEVEKGTRRASLAATRAACCFSSHLVRSACRSASAARAWRRASARRVIAETPASSPFTDAIVSGPAVLLAVRFFCGGGWVGHVLEGRSKGTGSDGASAEGAAAAIIGRFATRVAGGGHPRAPKASGANVWLSSRFPSRSGILPGAAISVLPLDFFFLFSSSTSWIAVVPRSPSPSSSDACAPSWETTVRVVLVDDVEDTTENSAVGKHGEAWWWRWSCRGETMTTTGAAAAAAAASGVGAPRFPTVILDGGEDEEEEEEMVVVVRRGVRMVRPPSPSSSSSSV